jgi:hypothetical protein
MRMPKSDKTAFKTVIYWNYSLFFDTKPERIYWIFPLKKEGEYFGYIMKRFEEIFN